MTHRDEIIALIDARFMQLIELHDRIILGGAMPTRDEFVASVMALPEPQSLTSSAEPVTITQVDTTADLAARFAADSATTAPATVERESSSPKIYAPWDSKTVDALNEFQYRGDFHPFTCPQTHLSDGEVKLHAYSTGWKCSDLACEYTQSWAHAFMIE